MLLILKIKDIGPAIFLRGFFSISVAYLYFFKGELRGC